MTAYATPIVDATEATLLDVDAKLATISTAIANILTQDTTTATKAEAIRALLAATLTVQGTVALDAASLAALESISVQNFPGDFPDAASLAKAEAIRALLAGTLGIAGTVAVSNFPGTQPVSAAALPLPGGAATAANQASVLARIPAALGQQTSAGSFSVTPANDIVFTISSLPLPGGAATSALQGGGLPSALGPNGGLKTEPAIPSVSPVTQVMTIGTGAGVVLPTSALANRRALFIRALDSNTGIIYIGSSTVTADTAVTGGKKLYPGDEFSDDLGTGSLYATSDTAAQKLYVYER